MRRSGLIRSSASAQLGARQHDLRHFVVKPEDQNHIRALLSRILVGGPGTDPQTDLIRYAEQVKTNAVRLLDTLGIQYELREYEVDPAALDAETVARKIGLRPEQVFKTLVARGDRNGVCLAVVPAHMELDEKALARLSGDRKIELVPLKEVQPLTGYVRGGVTSLAGKRKYPVFVDDTAKLFDVISVSAGVRGIQILLGPADYLAAVHGIVGAITRSKQ
jgi:Cys-tRNA(Pro)/Cys-tRNA(Cys) deacylase